MLKTLAGKCDRRQATGHSRHSISILWWTRLASLPLSPLSFTVLPRALACCLLYCLRRRRIRGCGEWLGLSALLRPRVGAGGGPRYEVGRYGYGYLYSEGQGGRGVPVGLPLSPLTLGPSPIIIIFRLPLWPQGVIVFCMSVCVVLFGL